MNKTRRRARVALLERVCAVGNQFAGAVGESVRALDNLAAAAEGKPLRHESMLPVGAEECDEIAERQQALERVREAVGVPSAG